MFIGASPDIYVSVFGLSEQHFGFLFGGNAMFSAIGPVLYMIVSNHFSTQKIIASTFFLSFVSGLFIILLGNHGPIVFALTVLPATVGASMIRPPSSNLLLEQGKEDAGAASSLMGFSFIFMGSMGLQFISLDWENRIFMLGLIYLLAGLSSLVLWPLAWKKCKAL